MDYNLFMILWAIFFITTSFAQDASIEEFCFASAPRMQAISAKAKFIFVPSDETSQDGPCLTVKTRPHRRELVQNYIRNLDPEVRISFSSAEVRRTMCELKVEKIRQDNSKENQIILGPRSVVNADLAKSQSQNTSQIKTMGDFELRYNQDTIKGNCRYITPDRYEITLEVRKDPRPIYPQIPNGTIVVLNNPPPPPDEKTSFLTTSIQLNKGQRIEVGSVVNDLNQDKNKVENSPEASHQNQKRLDEEKIFLSIE